MRKIASSTLLIFLSIVLMLSTSNAHAQSASSHILIKFKTNVSKDVQASVLFENGVDLRATVRSQATSQLTAQLDKIGTQIITIPESQKDAIVSALSKHPLIEFAEPDFQAAKVGSTNDPSLSNEWGLYKIHVVDNSNTSAWDKTTGNAAVKVAVLDTGIDQFHPELAGQVALTQNFTTGSSSNDGDGHGSHVAGVIGAIGNNNAGIAGISYNGQLMNGKVLDDTGSGYYSWISSGIIWAADNGAKVINMSLGGTSSSNTLSDAVSYALSKGVVIAAAAGNAGAQTKFYPAAYSGVLSVAATDENDIKPYWSNYGSWVLVAAPGTNIYSTYKNGGYQTMQGTSMATSLVSGEAALIWSYGNCADSTCVVQTIENTADHVTGSGSQFKYGRINALAALAQQPTPSATPTSTPTVTLTPTPTPTPSPSAPSSTPPPPTSSPTPPLSKTLHVSSIDASYTKSATLFNITFKVTVKDAQNALAKSALTSVSVNTPLGATYSGAGNTNQNGLVQFNLRGMQQKGDYTLTVTNISKSGYTFDLTGNSKILNVQ